MTSSDAVQAKADVPPVPVSQRGHYYECCRPQNPPDEGVADVGAHWVAVVVGRAEVLQIDTSHVQGIRASVSLGRILYNLEAFFSLYVVEPSENKTKTCCCFLQLSTTLLGISAK